uniref:Post-GPI attachment to proteins factor 2 n=1 Tax=Parascaris univalens TaxID=6257 RepID=A0A915CEC6_PARUN
MAVIGEEELLAIPFRWFVYVVAGMPMFALFSCIALSVTLHLEEATRTHCGVPNWLPSISAAVASFPPERYIWRLLIALHSAPRYAVAFAFRNLLLTSPLRPLTAHTWFPFVCHLACATNIAENTFLLLLTSISSTENYLLHKTSFGGFALCAMLYMFVATWLFHYSGRRRTSSLGERSFQYKVLMCGSSTISLLMAAYFFYRHNAFCEPGLYTLFAIAEYALVISNVLFHSTLLFDFHGRRFVLGSAGSSYHYQPLLPLHDPSKRSS